MDGKEKEIKAGSESRILGVSDPFRVNSPGLFITAPLTGCVTAAPLCIAAQERNK